MMLYPSFKKPTLHSSWIGRRGFTLVELMVAVAIVGILASIATPMYQQYIIKSYLAEPLQMAQPIKLYTQMALDRGDFKVLNSGSGNVEMTWFFQDGWGRNFTHTDNLGNTCTSIYEKDGQDLTTRDELNQSNPAQPNNACTSFALPILPLGKTPFLAKTNSNQLVYYNYNTATQSVLFFMSLGCRNAGAGVGQTCDRFASEWGEVRLGFNGILDPSTQRFEWSFNCENRDPDAQWCYTSGI